MNKKYHLASLIVCGLLLVGCTSSYQQQPQVQQFIQEMVTEHNFNRDQLVSLFSQMQPNKKVIAAMTRPHESLPWYRYYPIFLTEDRANQGANFWRQHQQSLSYAEQHYGVPAAIIVAVLGVETRYGKTQGGYKAFDALSTLAFNYPPRKKYFQSELEQYLLLTRSIQLDPTTVMASYAGALGQPQFMPSSYRTYAVSYSNNGRPDLFHNSDDAIVSIANYLKSNGWQQDGLVAVPAQVLGKLKYAKQRNINPQKDFLIKLQAKNGPEYWLGFHNFHVIMSYNASPLYAMAVYQLSEWIKKDYKK